MINVLVEKPSNNIETVLATLWRRTEGRVKKVLQFRITRGFTVKIVLVDKPTNTLKLEPALLVD